MIDFHIHLSRPEHLRPWVAAWHEENIIRDSPTPGLSSKEAIDSYLERVLAPEGLRAILQENGIDWAVGLADPTPITTGWTSNEYVAELCRAANEIPDPAAGPKGRLIPFGSLNPFIENDLAAELERLVQSGGIGGIKVYPVYHHHYPNDSRMYPLYAKAQEMGLPVLVHTGSSVFKGARIKYGDPLLLDDVAVDFPGLKILLAHSGRPFWYAQAFWMARRHANVYMEISGLPAKHLMSYFPRLELIPDKIVYGSDWPGNPDLRRNIEAIQALPISDITKQAILHGNAARILGSAK